MRAVKSVTIDSERRVIITFLDGSTETLYPNCIWCDSEALRQLIKDLLEEKADAIIQTIENVTTATFADGADEALIRKLLVNIEPIQEGSGDPSPENVRPITGRTGLMVTRSGKNLFLSLASGGQPTNISFVRNNDGSVIFTGQANGVVRVPTVGNVTLPAGTYILSGVTGGSESTYGLRISDYTTGTQVVLATIYSGEAEFTLTNESLVRVMGRFSNDKTDAYSVTMYPMIRLASSMDGTYEPYNSTVYSVNWESEAGTVYGGTLDVVSGKLTVDRAYIASYNEETLPSTWISDRDVYAAGTTPTTGAQVVYKLATPTEIQLTPQEITTLLGANNIWANSGNILELEYVADTKLYISESQSTTLGSGRQTITSPEIQPVSEKTVEDLTEIVKTETEDKETQEETEDERGE